MATTTKTKPARSRRQAPPKEENDRQRFLRIGQARMVNALHAIRLLGNLAGQGYDYTPDDIALMHNTVQEAVATAFGRFQKTGSLPKLEETFSLQPGPAKEGV